MSDALFLGLEDNGMKCIHGVFVNMFRQPHCDMKINVVSHLQAMKGLVCINMSVLLNQHCTTCFSSNSLHVLLLPFGSVPRQLWKFHIYIYSELGTTASIQANKFQPCYKPSNAQI